MSAEKHLHLAHFWSCGNKLLVLALCLWLFNGQSSHCKVEHVDIEREGNFISYVMKTQICLKSCFININLTAR